MNSIDQWVRPNIKDMEPYSSAREEYKLQKGVFLDANENPFGRFNRYPDPYQKEVKARIAEIKQISRSQLFLGNGSDEAIDLLFRIFCQPGKDKALQWNPTYGMYQVAAAVNNVELISLPLDSNFQPDPEKMNPYLENEDVKLLFLCSPNNPTGNSMDQERVKRILDIFQGIVVIDEAYIDFSTEPSWMHKIEEYPNLVVLQTLSKAWGLAALRIGMAIAQESIIDYLNKVKPPYNISQPNQEKALQRLKDPGVFRSQVDQILKQREWLKTELGKLSIIQKIYPSDANFLLVKVKNAGKLYDRLLDYGLVVRNRSRLVDNSLRISVGTEKENKLLIDTLQRITNEESIIHR